MASKSTILNLRLDPEDKAWLEGQVEELGLDNVSAVMRSLIRRARKGRPGVADADRADDAEDERRRRAAALAEAREAERKAKAAELRRQLAALDAGEDPDTFHAQQNEVVEDVPFEPAPDDFEVPPDSDGGNVTEFKPLPTGFKPPGSLARPAGAANGLVADRSPAGESMKRNYHHLLPR